MAIHSRNLRPTRNPFRAGCALVVATLVLAGCASAPPYYGPKQPGQQVGYTDQLLDRNRYRVTYSGDSATPRETVEDFLLLRAAEVTARAGYAFFVFDTRDTKARTGYYSTFTGWDGPPGFGWRPFGGPFDQDEISRPITQYDAYAEIIMLTDAEAAKDTRAIRAQSILQRLGPEARPASPPRLTR